MVLVEGLAVGVHQRIAGPSFRDQHHHRMRQRIAAAHKEFERIIEAGGVGLALIGDRPKLADPVAEQRRGDRRLARRHPVQIAAQRIDFAVVRDKAIGMRKPPGREGVRREALMHERQRRRQNARP